VNTQNDKIRVLHLIHTLETGGAQKVIVNLIRGIDKSHFDFSTTCLKKKGPCYDEIKTIGGKVDQVTKKGKIDFTLIPRLKEHIKEGKYDILHTHNFSAGLWGRLAAIQMKKNCPILVHTEHGRLGDVPMLRKIIIRYLAQHTDRIIAVSKETSDYLLHNVGLPEDRVSVIKNGIDLQSLELKKDARVEFIENILKKDPNAIFIVNVSALSAVKDHETLIKAYKILHGKMPYVHLLLVGDGPLRLGLIKLASSLGVDGNVHFLGERHDVGAILAKCRIFVMSSLLEGNPISLLEAMGMGLVPVTTSVGGLPELIENTVNGLMVPPSEPALLANAIRIPLENPKLAIEWSKKSRELILREYTAEVMSKRHEELYCTLIQKRDKK